MSRIETITTKVRPIKKLCIIDYDFDLFCEINNAFTEEIGGFFNLILLNNNKIFSQNTLDFINYHDPDIIINYSKCDNELLLKAFNIRVIDPKIKKDFNLKHYIIPISVLDKIPDYAKTFFSREFNKIITFNNLIKNPEYSVNFINFGSLSIDEEKEIRKNTSFQGIKISIAQRVVYGNLNIFEIKEKNLDLLFFYNMLYRQTISDNIYSVNNNIQGYFLRNSTIIFGNSDDLDSIIYFWNTRATYPSSEIIWIPIELYDEYLYGIMECSNFCIFDTSDNLRTKLNQICKNYTEIDHDKYYFNSSYEGWSLFENIMNVTFNDDHVRLLHPQSKLFSKSGLNVNIALEIKGIEETFLPKSPYLGRMFKKDDPHHEHHFLKIGSNGLAILLSDFNPLEESPLFEEITIPTDIQIFKEIFNERDLEYKESKQSQIINQVINLLGGHNNIEILKDPVIFDLIVKIAPKRIERIVKDLSKELQCHIDIEKFEKFFSEKIRDNSTLISETYVEADDFFSRAGGGRKVHDKKNFQSKIERLYYLNFLLRGKNIICQRCGTTLWYPISELKDDLKCYCCNNNLKIPIYNISKAQNDSFKLNELICKAVDQGVLPVLLTAHILYNQKYRAIRFIYDSEIREKGDLIGEIDIIFTLGKKLGIVEVKADRGFEASQIDRLLELKEKLRADFIIFSTLKEASSEEINELIKYLNPKEVNYPIFIFTKEHLFHEKVVDLSKYFHVDLKTESFPKGIIIPDTYIEK